MSTTPRQAPPLFSPAPAPRGRNLTALSLVALAAICAIALALQIYHFWPFMADDGIISLRYSQRLIEGHGLTWNDMRPAVEGYTNLLWVLICAGLGALGMNLETAAHLLGIVTTVAGIAAVAAQVYRDFPAKVRFHLRADRMSRAVAERAGSGVVAGRAGAAAAGGAAGVGGVLRNSLGLDDEGQSARCGCDGPAAGAGGVVACGRCAVHCAVLCRRRAGGRRADADADCTIAAAADPDPLFSRAGDLPPCVLRRVGAEHGVREGGLHAAPADLPGCRYDVYGVRSEFVFLALALIGCVALWIAGKRRQVILLATVSVGWLLYILVIGGDIFPSYRHFVPAMALMGFLVAGCGLLTLGAPFRFSRVRVAIFLLLTLLVLTSDFFA